MLAAELTVRPISSIFIGIAQIGLICVAICSGWSSVSYDFKTITSNIPLVYRGTVPWEDVSAYHISWTNHELLQDGRPVLRVPSLSQTQKLWDECERRGITRAK